MKIILSRTGCINGQVKSVAIGIGQVQSVDIGHEQVTGDDLAGGAVGVSELADGAVPGRLSIATAASNFGHAGLAADRRRDVRQLSQSN